MEQEEIKQVPNKNEKNSRKSEEKNLNNEKKNLEFQGIFADNYILNHLV